MLTAGPHPPGFLTSLTTLHTPVGLCDGMENSPGLHVHSAPPLDGVARQCETVFPYYVYCPHGNTERLLFQKGWWLENSGETLR